MIRNKPRYNIDLEQLRKLPKNLITSLLRILSKRGYLTDENIYAVSYIFIKIFAHQNLYIFLGAEIQAISKQSCL